MSLTRSLRPRWSSHRPRLEVLEDRLAPAVVTWDGSGGDFRWENAFNWSDDALPGSAADVQINTPGITVSHTSSAGVLINSLFSLANMNWQGQLRLLAVSQ